MKTILSATVLLALVGSIASAQTMASPAAPAVATTTTTTAATEVKAAKKWSGTLSLNPEFAAAGANRLGVDNKAKRGSVSSENYVAGSYKITDKTTLSLRQYFYNDYNWAAEERAEHSYLSALTPVVSTRIGGIAGSKDINLQGRVYLGTGEDFRDMHLGAMYLGVVDVPWEITSKLTLNYGFVPQAYGFWDQDTEIRLLNAGTATYQITDKISIAQNIGWRPWFDSIGQGRLIRESLYLETAASFTLSEAMSLDLGIYQFHHTYGKAEKSNSNRVGSALVKANRFAKGSSEDMIGYNEDESVYYLLTSVKF
ncbi:MAG: hypothetical protein AB7O96_16350 [Pseudobdellovibrionaceae bacterium]